MIIWSIKGVIFFFIKVLTLLTLVVITTKHLNKVFFLTIVTKEIKKDSVAATVTEIKHRPKHATFLPFLNKITSLCFNKRCYVKLKYREFEEYVPSKDFCKSAIVGEQYHAILVKYFNKNGALIDYHFKIK